MTTRGIHNRYKRAPHLMAFWSRQGLVAQNVADVSSTPITPFVIDLLDRCTMPRSADVLAKSYGVSRSKALVLLRRLVKAGLLRTTDVAASGRDVAWSTWDDWMPARFFHVATKDLRFDSGTKRSRRVGAWPRFVRPSATKRLRGRLFKLASPIRDGEFRSVLAARRTWRSFARHPVPFGEFSTLLNLTAGVQGWTQTRTAGRVPFKTSPSGGARHPIETYVAALNCQGVHPGLYHYSADRHGLTRIGRFGRSDVRQLLPQQPWYAAAGAVVFFTAVVARTMWRYPYARAYRALLIEAGHVCQTFCLTATWLGLAPFCTLALADTAIERKLGIDGTSEIVLYAAGVGSRPRGVAWAPRPDQRPARLRRHMVS